MKRQRRGGFLIGRIHQTSRRIFGQVLRQQGVSLSHPQGRVLFGLWQNGAMPIAEIVTRTGLSKSTLTGVLDRLERDGYVRRVRSTADRRVVLIEAAARDARAQAAFIRASEEMTAIFYEGFTAARIDRFEDDLARILENLSHGPVRTPGSGTRV
jgi:MarR family transcriptional regulator, organic hydroperoxide resistance regulator